MNTPQTRPPQRGFSRGRQPLMTRSIRSKGLRRDSDRPIPQKKPHDIIPPLGKDIIRIVPLGGVEEVGRNMTAIEFRDDIIVIDAGIQFTDAETPGVDYILANTKYLED